MTIMSHQLLSLSPKEKKKLKRENEKILEATWV